MPGQVSDGPRSEAFFDALDSLPSQKTTDKESFRPRNSRFQPHISVFNEQKSSTDGQYGGNGRDNGKLTAEVNDDGSEFRANLSALRKDQRNVLGKRSVGKGEIQLLDRSEGMVLPSQLPRMGGFERSDEIDTASDLLNRQISSELVKNPSPLTGTGDQVDWQQSESGKTWDAKSNVEMNSAQDDDSRQRWDMEDVPAKTQATCAETVSRSRTQSSHKKSSSGCMEDGKISLPGLGRPPTHGVAIERGPAPLSVSSGSMNHPELNLLQSDVSRGIEARNRWRRVKHTLKFAHHMSHNLRSNSSDFLEHSGEEHMAHEMNIADDAGRAGAAAFEGARLKGRFRAKGRKGMEGMIVKQEKGIFTLIQDFYVACLKMPIAHFLIGVFLAPIALGLLFTPVYLIDRGGLSFNGVPLAEEIIMVSRVAAAKQKVSALVNVFLYALSLSTTFGGSPVDALSPFCLCVANVNTLMGQFLFVFLSGAVFARMSQPSHPIRCSKVAIIRQDDFTQVPSDEGKEKSKVFAVRLVLTGPAPCELVDAKICLTFRIFIKLPSGSVFCSTQDLDLVRPEVSYLRYGIMVRHIIDHKSPVHGHTLESLTDGDASFSLTVMGLERTSMQPIFHLEDYFVCDGDVAWDADYIDFIHINNEGHRVLDHSKIDLIKSTKVNKETETSEGKNKQGSTEAKEDQSSTGILRGWNVGGMNRRKVYNSKSTSFTRADW